MTTTRDGSIDTTSTASTTISGGIQLPTHPVNRGVTVDAQEKKCYYCRQDRQKCEWKDGQDNCDRCERLGYTCADQAPAAADTTRRTLRFEKCSFCRQSRQKCLPVDRILPARCDRCVSKGLACSEPQKKNVESRKRPASEFAMPLSPQSSTGGNGPSPQTGQRPEPVSKRQRVQISGSQRDAPPRRENTSQREYGYTPLAKGKFRVLELKGGPRNADIVCELHQWDEQIKYEAVSYLRSFDEGLPITMLAPDKRRLLKTVMPNLHAALKHLRLSDRSRFLYINAICIDHSNTQEKSDNVHVVHKIFSQASNVCLWLGEKDGSTKGDTRIAFDFADRLLAPKYFDEAANDVGTVKQWKALLDLISHQLFERRWIVQEVAVAGKATLHYGDGEMKWSNFADVVTMFEHAEKQDHAISRLFRESREFRHQPDLIGDIQALGASRFINLTSNVFKQSRTESDTGDATTSLLSLEDLVFQLAAFEGGDSHDVIYACVPLSRESHGTGFAESEPSDLVRKAADKFLDLLRRKSRYDETPVVLRTGQINSVEDAIAALLRNESSGLHATREIDSFVGQGQCYRTPYNVNYDLPVLSTYREFVAHVLRQSKSLGILCRPWAPSKDNLDDYIEGGVPSWIPTLDRAAFGKSPTLKGYVRINADPLIGPPGKEPYKASLGLPASWTFPDARSGRNRLLHVEGFVLTTISETRTEALGGNIPSKWLQFAGWHRRDEKPQPKMAQGNHVDEDTEKDSSAKDGWEDQLPPESLWRTLVADRGPNGSNAPVFYRRACQYAFKHIGVASAINTDQLLDSISLSMVKEFLQRVQEVVWNRQLIKTKRGYLGLAPEGAEKTDLVCILYGCSVPVVIREIEGGKHELVGECYIHGMMDGAALGVQLLQKIPKTTFKLQ